MDSEHAAKVRGLVERLRRDGRDAAVAGGRAWALLLGASALVLALGAWRLDAAFAATLPVAALGAAAVLARWAWGPMNDSRPDAAAPSRRLNLALAATLGSIASVPWLLAADAPEGVTALAAAATVAAALFGAWASAPLPAVAAVAAALPLSTALEASASAAGGSSPLAFAALLGSALSGALAAAEHRRWRAGAVARYDASDAMHRLQAARDAAVRADQEKSRFLAIASHDLRQPVHAIGLFAATLERRLAGSAEEPLVRNLSRAIDGLDRSFGAMLDLSRLDAGATRPRLRRFPLRDLFRRLHMHFAGLAEQKGLGLRFSPGGKSVTSDPELLERVLGNLVQNAIKYTERGGIVVVARSTATETRIEIWDTGVGIRATELGKVFEEFYQVGSGERVRTQGLGMGLAIVDRLARLLGHALTVASRPGRGTMFRLGIANGGVGVQDVTAGAATLPMPRLRARRVLVLDDEAPIREGLCLLLHEWGYDAVGVASIDDALDIVDRQGAPPDLILSDLHLGGPRNGIDGIAAIRGRCGSEVAAMLITGDTSATEIRRVTDSGHRVLIKPVQPRKLYDALCELES